MILSVLEGCLTCPSWQIETATDALQALMKARDLRPFCILTDVQMPSYGRGTDMLRALRMEKATATTPVIILTGMNLERVKPLIAPNDARVRLFNKPPNYDLIVGAIKELTGIDGRVA